MCITIIHLVNLLVPLTPTGFKITREYRGNMTTTITLNWNTLQDNPEAAIHNYSISISSAAPNLPTRTIFVPSPPLNVTLTHMEVYTINLVALNCPQRSGPATLQYFFNGEFANTHLDLVTTISSS